MKTRIDYEKHFGHLNWDEVLDSDTSHCAKCGRRLVEGNKHYLLTEGTEVVLDNEEGEAVMEELNGGGCCDMAVGSTCFKKLFG